MKKRFLSILLTASILTSCDPGFSQQFLFQNDSEHDVTIVALIDTADMYFVSPIDSIRLRWFENPDGITIPAGKTVTILHDGGLGVASEIGVADRLRCIYSDSVRFVFDNGRYLFFHADVPAPHSPYDDASYTFEGDFHRFGSEGVSTYILTNDDYARAGIMDSE